MNARANVLGPALEFAKILSENPEEANKAEIHRGNKFILIFNDDEAASKVPQVKDLKVTVLKMAIEDISGRAHILSTNTLGVTLLENEAQTFLTPFGTLTKGKIVYKIGIKNVSDFLKWRQGERCDISQEDVNSAIYALVYEWSKLL